MQDILMYTKNAYFYYCYYGFPLSLVIAAILYLFFEKEATKKKVWIYFASATIIGICPLAIWLVIKFWLPMTEYWKVFYLLPIAIILAYAATVFWSKVAGRKKQWIVSAIFVIIIGMAIHFNASGEQLRWISNSYKISEKVVSVSETLKKYDLQEAPLIVPADLTLELCSYLEGAKVVESISNEESKIFASEMWLDAEGTLATKLEMVREGYAKAIIIDTAYDNEAFMRENGFVLLGNNEDYYIYTYME